MNRACDSLRGRRLGIWGALRGWVGVWAGTARGGCCVGEGGGLKGGRGPARNDWRRARWALQILWMAASGGWGLAGGGHREGGPAPEGTGPLGLGRALTRQGARSFARVGLGSGRGVSAAVGPGSAVPRTAPRTRAGRPQSPPASGYVALRRVSREAEAGRRDFRPASWARKRDPPPSRYKGTSSSGCCARAVSPAGTAVSGDQRSRSLALPRQDSDGIKMALLKLG